MDQVLSDYSREDEAWEQIRSALENGIIFVRSNGEIAWVDGKTRRRLNGGLRNLELPLRPSNERDIVCLVTSADVVVNGKKSAVCVVQETIEQKTLGQDLVAAIEAVMSDTSGFTRAIVDKLKSLRQGARPNAPSNDLELLTERECEVLGLICEGRSDEEMSRMLKLSPNTVRNHIASLFRKIGVNRRSAAIIWARERAITGYDAVALRRAARPRPLRK
jgi:DNA-binding NarL/FixJ family response regulator